MIERPIDEINLGSLKIKKMSRTLSDVPNHEPLALLNSFGLLDIAINTSSAADSLGIGLGARGNVIRKEENLSA